MTIFLEPCKEEQMQFVRVCPKFVEHLRGANCVLQNLIRIRTKHWHLYDFYYVSHCKRGPLLEHWHATHNSILTNCTKDSLAGLFFYIFKRSVKSIMIKTNLQASFNSGYLFQFHKMELGLLSPASDVWPSYSSAHGSWIRYPWIWRGPYFRKIHGSNDPIYGVMYDNMADFD